VKREQALISNTWTKHFLGDMKELKIQTVKHSNNRVNFSKISSAYPQY